MEEMTALENPFTSILSSLKTTESDLYNETRTTRLNHQLSLLQTSCKFNRDEILSRLVDDEGTDSRNSLIFIARPSIEIANGMQKVQDAILDAFRKVGEIDTVEGVIWTTPRENLHMTVLDLLSCVSRHEIDLETTRFSTSRCLSAVEDETQVTLTQPRLMIDQTALAVTFSTAGHLRLREQLVSGAMEAGTVPKMRYVAVSAHVTLVRFLQDVVLSPAQMTRMLRTLTNLDLTAMTEWQIRKADVQCVYGQVFYGGGQVLQS